MSSSLPYSDYLSVRITLAHSKINEMIEAVLSGTADYIIYAHRAGLSNEHVHILVPIAPDVLNKERYRKRARSYLGVTGRSNAVCVKGFSNGIQSGCTYGGRRGDRPIVSSDCMQALVDSAPAWVDKQGGQLMLPAEESRKVRDWQLTYSNLVSQAIEHARVHSLTGELKSVVKHMLDNTKWKPSYQMVKNGVPDFYILDFQRRTGKRSDRDMSWFDFKA